MTGNSPVTAEFCACSRGRKPPDVNFAKAYAHVMSSTTTVSGS
jgi:hypothetical protein